MFASMVKPEVIDEVILVYQVTSAWRSYKRERHYRISLIQEGTLSITPSRATETNSVDVPGTQTS